MQDSVFTVASAQEKRHSDKSAWCCLAWCRGVVVVLASITASQGRTQTRRTSPQG
jgi:hypothetical protein